MQTWYSVEAVPPPIGRVVMCRDAAGNEFQAVWWGQYLPQRIDRRQIGPDSTRWEWCAECIVSDQVY